MEIKNSVELGCHIKQVGSFCDADLVRVAQRAFLMSNSIQFIFCQKKKDLF